MTFAAVASICCSQKTNVTCCVLVPAGLQWRDQTGAAERALAAERLRRVEPRQERAGEECTTGSHHIHRVKHYNTAVWKKKGSKTEYQYFFTVRLRMCLQYVNMYIMVSINGFSPLSGGFYFTLEFLLTLFTQAATIGAWGWLQHQINPNTPHGKILRLLSRYKHVIRLVSTAKFKIGNPYRPSFLYLDCFNYIKARSYA